MYRIDPKRLDLVRRFRVDPFARHEGELRQLLVALRLGPVAGKLVAVPHERGWQLARLSPHRYGQPERLDVIVDHLREAEWEIFRLRWEASTGKSLAAHV